MVLPEGNEALRGSLLRMGLIGVGEVPSFTALTGGVSSEIVLAITAHGPICIKRALPKLKVTADWAAPVERNSAEVAWMKLAARVVPGAVPAILGEDSEAQAFAMGFLDPSSYPVWKDQLRDGTAVPATAHAVAQILVAIHRATAKDENLAHEFAKDANFYALRLEPYFVSTAAANPDCADALQHVIDIESQIKLALVHGDVSPKNILIGADGPVLLDAECACYGDPAFDLAFCLTHLLLKCVWRPHAASKFLHCFDELATTYLAGVTWEQPEELESRAALLLPAMLLARVDGKSPVEYLVDPTDRERIRQLVKPLVIEPPKRLATIRTLWSKDYL